MHKQHGFTILELLITLVVMGMLLTLGVVGFQRYQMNARDQERETDVLAIHDYLESIYSQEIRDSSGTIIKPANSYPTITNTAYYTGTSRTYNPYDNAQFRQIMEGLPIQAVTAPGQSDISLRVPRPNYMICTEAANCHTYPENAATASVNEYVYTSRSSGRIMGQRGCAGDGTARCDKYTIKYLLESDPNTLKTIESKR